jgi:CheY-like chemotaxis protein
VNRHYLIVDDNRAFAENVGEIVRDLGDEVSVVDGGHQALQLVRRKRYHALVSDMRMPHMGGADLLREIRSLDPGLPAIVVTAHVGDAELESARREGVLAILSKPVPIGQLLDLLGAARRDGLAVVVEDDARLSDNLCEALRGRGFAAVTAGSVLETEALAPLRPFAAVADLHVPGGPAGEAMRRLAGRYPGLPILAITGYGDTPPVPCEVLLHKPFDTGALLAALERCHGRAAAPAGRA